MAAGLTAMDALGGYQQGVEWGQRQQELQRQRKLRDGADAANAEFGRVISEGQAKFDADWEAANPAQPAGLDSPATPRQRPSYRPDESTLFRAAEARGIALARAGDVEGYFKNDAAVAPMRIKARAAALQRFQADGNIEQLVRSAHATMFDGQDIESVETVKGGSGGLKGAPSGPDMVRITFKGGKTDLVKPEDVVGRIKASLTDPVTFAQKEAELNYQRALQDVKTQGQLKVEDRRHDNSLKLEGERAKNRKEEIGLRGEHALSLADARQEGAVEVANIRAGATLGAARTRSSGGGGGTGGGAGQRVQRTMTDADGNTVLVFRDGRTELAKIDGKPVRAGDFGKRVDSLAKSLRSTPDFIGKPEAEVRQAAMDALTKPGLPAAAPAPGPGLDSRPAAGGRPPLSSFMSR